MEELVEKAKRGNEQAFISLIEEKKLELYKIAKARLKREEDIEDAMQETILVAYSKLHKLKENSSFYPWLIRILINNCMEVYRKRKGVIIPIEEVSYELENTDYQQMESKITYDWLMEKIKPEDRIFVLLHYNHGYTTKQIAKITGENENTIKTKLRRIREKLKKEIGGK